jgi:hypothetical protein
MNCERADCCWIGRLGLLELKQLLGPLVDSLRKKGVEDPSEHIKEHEARKVENTKFV